MTKPFITLKKTGKAPMSNVPSQERVTARHEASHAVCAYLLGVPLKSVWLATDGSGDGGFDTSLKMVSERRLWPECAVVAAMGRVAERQLFGQHNPDACKDDQRLIEKAAKEVFRREEQKTKRTEFKRSLPRFAKEIMEIPRFFDAVEAVAQELEEQKEKELERRKELDGKRVEQIIRQHIPDPAAVQSGIAQRLHQLL